MGITMTADAVKRRSQRAMSEAKFQTIVLQIARLNGWKAAHFRKVRVQRPNGSVYYATPVAADGAGFVDLVLVRERLIFAELKTMSGVVEPDQEAWHERLRKAGQTVYVWRPVDLDMIEEALA